jgi:transposase
MNPGKAQALSPELQAALGPLLGAIESLSERIGEYNERIEQVAKQSYPEVARLTQVKGVGTLIALTYVLTLEDAHRFDKSRDAGCYVGLQPGRRNSGQSAPQLHISKEGDPYLRTLLVQGAHHILGPFGADNDLRRWGLKHFDGAGWHYRWLGLSPIYQCHTSTQFQSKDQKGLSFSQEHSSLPSMQYRVVVVLLEELLA